MFSKFVGLYKMSKTLRFELLPIGKTLENLKKSGALERDFVRAEKYQLMKSLLDAQHKALLERALSSVDNFVRCFGEKERKRFADILTDDVKINWTVLSNAYDDFRVSPKDKVSRDTLECVCALFRALLVEIIKSDDRYKILSESTPKDFIKELLAAHKSKRDIEEITAETFSGFACYFTGFQQNRANIYSDKKEKTAAANRAINENFPRFLECCRIFDHLVKTYPEIIEEVKVELCDSLHGISLNEVFKPNVYSSFLYQGGIDRFNLILGGKTLDDGRKIRGINEFINLKRQNDENAKHDKRLGKMPQLYKQILSDRESLSFVSEKFAADSDVLSSISKFAQYLTDNKVLEKLQVHLQTIKISDRIFIDREELATISKSLCGDWRALQTSLEHIAEMKFSTISANRARETEISRWLKRSEYPLSDFGAACYVSKENYEVVPVDICSYWKNENSKKVFGDVACKFDAARSTLNSDEKLGLRERKEDVEAIKAYLDSLMAVLHLVKPLHVSSELNRDMDFYGEFDSLYDVLEDVIGLYNQVRNYITKKPSEEKKLKLMFDSPTLADGWDQNKEDANNAVLFEREGLYYLGVVNPKKIKKERPDFRKLKSENEENCYRKVVYKLLPGPNKMLPKVFFSAKGLPVYKPSSNLLARYKNGDYKKGANFDLSFCHELIDFFKASITQHPDWCKFGFKFLPTNTYSGIDEFYREISEQGYKISFDNISVATIDSLVENGSLYLFKLHNKDFSSGATGRENLHTIYWKMLFDADNLADVVFKLNGEAELFYRRAGITKPYSHREGEKLVNRIDSDGNPIPSEIFGELFRFANNQIDYEKLSAESKRLYEAGKVTIKDVKHQIIKDRRFTEDKFFFHVPITINARANDRVVRFNDDVNNVIRDSENVNIIGIDRGERHLLYVTVVNREGKILEQCSFNTIGKSNVSGQEVVVDYHAKLDQVEKGRDDARKSWSQIEQIKDLKAGYLSLVIHEIAKMMVKYNAIIVLEDLNAGFKRGRFAVEKQVYQKFEKALIDKLNYLVFKDRNIHEDGGALRGYQFADKFESFEKLGKQTGFVYYVPASYTSKIDPTTGFTNIFDLKKCTSAENIKAFFGLFDSILYKENSFVFSFDYNKFKTRFPSWRPAWEVYTASRRLVFDVNARKEVEINPTQKIIDALVTRGIRVEEGFDLGEYMRKEEANRDSASFFRDVFYSFERTLQMRNSCASTGEDYIESPVKNKNGEFFDSRKSGLDLPRNADANGAYHIALKGLLLMEELKASSSPKLAISNEQWLEFAQRRN